MNILVCISNVPDTTSKINFVENDSNFDTNGVQFVINPNDEFGLTKAVWMKEIIGRHRWQSDSISRPAYREVWIK